MQNDETQMRTELRIPSISSERNRNIHICVHCRSFLTPVLSLLAITSLILLSPLPIPHMRQNDTRRLLGTMLPSNGFDKIPLRIHQVEINTMIHQVVLTLLHVLRCRKINSVFLAYVLNLLPGTSETDNGRVELREVFGKNTRGIARWITCYEDGEEGWQGRRGFGRGEKGRGVDKVDHLGHFVQFFRADVWTMGESEVDL